MKKFDIRNSQEIYNYTDNNFDITYNIFNNSKLIVYQYGYNISGNIIINLNGENAEIEYHFSNINYDDNELNIIINHNKSNTISNIYNHGINILNNNLQFNITGKVLKNSYKCIVNQENQIINLKDGNGTIKPNLLIDNFDVISSHSAYIGKFKDDLLFYLMSRGINKNKAIKLLAKGLLINGGNNEEVLQCFIEKIDSI